jgi:hypothetical protein
MGTLSDLPPPWLKEEMEKDWHQQILQNWGLVEGSPGGTLEQRAAELHRRAEGEVKETRNPKYQTRALALDLLCASFPEGRPPPDSLVVLMRCILKLPKDHTVGGWMGALPIDDPRGSPTLSAMEMAAKIDSDYFHSEAVRGRDLMPVRRLSKVLKAQGYKTSPATLRKWREDDNYKQLAGLPPHEFEPPAGARRK